MAAETQNTTGPDSSKFQLIRASRKQFSLGISLITFCLAIASGSSFADVIATSEFSGSGGSSGITGTMQITLNNGGATNGGSGLIFDSFFFTPSQVGQVFVVSQSVDPQFNLFVSRLTNGVNDIITRVVKVGGSFGSNISESNFFLTRPPTGNGIDLQGFVIDEIDLQLNQISLNSPGSDPNHNGNWTDYSFDASFSFLGRPVPEPSALNFGILALACRLFFPRRRAQTGD